MTAPSVGAGTYFYTPSLKDLVQQLTHLAFSGDGLSVVSGAMGSGKSALAEELVPHLEQAYKIVPLRLEVDLELAEGIEKVSATLGLIKEETSLSVGEMLAGLRHYVQALAQDKKLIILIVDDAHHLDDQAIGALVSLLQGRTDSNLGLHLIFMSEPGLDSRIDALQILDVPVYDFEMPNLSPSELARFLSRGSSFSESLNSAKVQKIWAGSQGLPGTALQFVEKHSESETRVKSTRILLPAGIPLGHAVAAVVLVIVLGWSLIFRQVDDAEKVASTAVISTPAEPSIDESVGSEPEGIAFTPFPESANDRFVVDQQPQGVGLGVEGLDEQVAELATDISGQGTLPGTEEKISLDSLQPPAIGERNTVVQPKPTMDGESKGLTESEVFLMAQNAEFYTLQVIAASKKELLERYISRQINQDTLKMYRGTREGKSWFVVVQGVYSTREVAFNALKLLPQEQVKAGSWPRKFSSIQEEIETFRHNQR